jgi:hypothetical protein
MRRRLTSFIHRLFGWRHFSKDAAPGKRKFQMWFRTPIVNVPGLPRLGDACPVNGNYRLKSIETIPILDSPGIASWMVQLTYIEA